MEIIDSNPAIAYVRDNYIYYVRASNTAGTSWNAPLKVVDDSLGALYVCPLAAVNGNPAIAYYQSASDDLMYIRATSKNGSNWPTSSTTIASFGRVGRYASLAVVNGVPAIAYHHSDYADLRFITAQDANGAAWNAAVIVDEVGNVGRYTSLQVVGGVPAIAYGMYLNTVDDPSYRLKYAWAKNAAGSSWNTPIMVDGRERVGEYVSLVENNGKPAIAYHDRDGGLRYAYPMPVTP
jgi:hypothetical protein